MPSAAITINSLIRVDKNSLPTLLRACRAYCHDKRKNDSAYHSVESRKLLKLARNSSYISNQNPGHVVLS